MLDLPGLQGDEIIRDAAWKPFIGDEVIDTIMVIPTAKLTVSISP